MTTTYRNPEGKYAKRRWFGKFFLIAILCVGIYYAYPHIKKFVNDVQFVNAYDPKTMMATTTVQTQAEIKANDIENRMKEVRTRPEFIAKVQQYSDTEARHVATDEYAAEEAAKYKAVQDEIEKSKEIVRQSQTSF